MRLRIDENLDKIKLNKQLPYLVSTAVEIIDDFDPDADAPPTTTSPAPAPSPAPAKTTAGAQEKKPKCVVIKTSTRQTVFLPVVGLVDPKTLKPGDLVGVNKDSYLVLEPLPAEYDARVKAMEVDERPQEEYSDIGGLDKQIQELVEAVVLPMTHKDRFEAIGIHPPKGVLLYGPPGTGKSGHRPPACPRVLLCTHIFLSHTFRQNTHGKSVCGANKGNVPEACWAAARADVHW
jgi:26S proteasome regulatory subunit T5